jgi:hypothetical protein
MDVSCSIRNFPLFRVRERASTAVWRRIAVTGLERWVPAYAGMTAHTALTFSALSNIEIAVRPKDGRLATRPRFSAAERWLFLR